jgi:hypothetical protein
MQTYFLARVFIALMMEAVRTSETSVSFYQATWLNVPEDSHLHPYRRENLKILPFYTSTYSGVNRKHRESNLE